MKTSRRGFFGMVVAILAAQFVPRLDNAPRISDKSYVEEVNGLQEWDGNLFSSYGRNPARYGLNQGLGLSDPIFAEIVSYEDHKFAESANQEVSE